MKILLSAYECQPNKGSEHGRGWSWATTLAKMGHEVWVIAQSGNQPGVDGVLQKNPMPNLHFIYCDLPNWFNLSFDFANANRIKLLPELLWRLVSLWWQWSAFKVAKSLTQEVEFDLVHHVTGMDVRRPSLMGMLGIPFILGPLAGGLRTPWNLRKGYPLIGWVDDLIRDFMNAFVSLNPLMHLTFARASKIYCDSKDTQELIPNFYRYKSEIMFSIPAYEIAKTPEIVALGSKEKSSFRVLFVGRFVYWKGIHLALQAFSDFHKKIPNSDFTLIGRGREEVWLRKLTEQLGLDNSVNWISWLDRKELSLAYLEHDMFLFPSLHEMGGNVVIESLSHGLPVICLDLGGPGVIVDQTCGRVITTDGLDEEAVIKALSNALVEIAENPELKKQLSEGALTRPAKFAFKDAVERIYPLN